MILTICPNPSIDCTIELDNLNVGMLNRVRNKVETYSGKALNVAKGIARLGESVTTTGFMFDDHAKMFEQSLEKEGVKHNFVYNHGAARVNYKIIDKRSMLTEINDRGETVSRQKQLELIDLVKKLSEDCNIVVMSGSLPSGVFPEFYDEVLSVIPSRVKKIVDAEKDNVLSALKSGGVYLVKPNLKELEEFSGQMVSSKKDIVKAALKYVNAGAENVLVSLGADGAVLTNGSESYYCKSASVAVNSTVGAGDCMVAATCVQLEKGVPMGELLKRSVAAGTAAITTSGTNLFHRDKYEEIYTKLTVEKL
ncbi:MAG: 1-phosphofructokinase family hexose kinase [Clostridiales bacterium]|nr:1-phosphofructokinase family hexose kinase [Clostridiales bacterium]